MNDETKNDVSTNQDPASMPIPEINDVRDLIPPVVEKEEKRSINGNAILGVLANFVIPLAALAGISLLAFLVILPSYNALPDLEQELERKEQLSDSLSQKYNKLRVLLDFETQVIENNNLLEGVLSEEPKVPELLTQIDLIARNAGLSVDRLAYSTGGGSASGTSDYQSISVALSTTSSYSQLVTFLADLENAGRIVVVDSVRFSVGSEEGRVSATYTLSSPYVKIETQAATDQPILFELSDQKFQKLMGVVKEMRIYDITIEDLIDLTPVEEVSDIDEVFEEDEELPIDPVDSEI